MIPWTLAVPMPGLPIGLIVGFLLGYGCAWALHADDDLEDNMTPPRWRTLYEHAAPFLVVFCLLVSMLASVGVYVTNNANRRQDREAETARAEAVATNRAFLRCLDDFASTLGAGLPPVRAATTDRDDALGRALVSAGGLRGLVRKINAGDLAPRDLRRLERRLDAYDQADRALDRAREANPYPPPPSKACPALTKGSNK